MILLGFLLPALTIGIFLISFVLNRRADPTPRTLIKTIFIIFQTIEGFSYPLTEVIFFCQCWRLDPILQFAYTLFAAGIAVEMAP